jgi:hypothetical protein
MIYFSRYRVGKYSFFTCGLKMTLSILNREERLLNRAAMKTVKEPAGITVAIEKDRSGQVVNRYFMRKF